MHSNLLHDTLEFIIGASDLSRCYFNGNIDGRWTFRCPDPVASIFMDINGYYRAVCEKHREFMNSDHRELSLEEFEVFKIMEE